MPGESQEIPSTGSPDPTVRTTEQMLQKVEDSEKEYNAKLETVNARLNAMDKAAEVLHETVTRTPTEIQLAVTHVRELFDVRMQAERDLGSLREAYRVELKADSKEALATAMIAAEKAVQAALAAAEKARDQETIRTQLATDKAEKAFIEALAQQQATFTVAIANVVEGVNEAKSGIADIRAEQRGGALLTTTTQASNSNTWMIVAGIVSIFVLMFIVAGFIATIYFSTRPGG